MSAQLVEAMAVERANGARGRVNIDHIYARTRATTPSHYPIECARAVLAAVLAGGEPEPALPRPEHCRASGDADYHWRPALAVPPQSAALISLLREATAPHDGVALALAYELRALVLSDWGPENHPGDTWGDGYCLVPISLLTLLERLGLSGLRWVIPTPGVATPANPHPGLRSEAVAVQTVADRAWAQGHAGLLLAMVDAAIVALGHSAAAQVSSRG